MNRRSLLATLGLGSVTLLSGCVNLEGTDGGVLTVMYVPPPPDATVVSSTDDPLDEADLIQRALDQATQQDPRGTIDFRLSRSEYRTVAETLERLPYYDRMEHDASVPSGFYVDHDGFGYRLAYRPLCSDVSFVSAENPRNRCWTAVPEDATTL